LKKKRKELVYSEDENISLFEWIESQISTQESAPPNMDMLGWMRYYLKKEVVGVEPWHTARAKIYDLWKFLNFFCRFYPGKNLLAWDKACSQSFANQK
jgi:hypothetical protein